MDVEIRSEKARKVAEWFGVKRDEKLSIDNCQLKIVNCIQMRPGTVTLITGPSGAGKSTLLRELRQRQRRRLWVDADAIELADVPVVDCFEDEDLENVLLMLGRVGLGEVWTYLRTPAELSVGQRWRLRLAIALWKCRGGLASVRAEARTEPGPPNVRAAARTEPGPPNVRAEARTEPGPPNVRAAARTEPGPPERELARTEPGPPVIVADEFAAVLDTISARIVARCLSRTIKELGNVAAVVATSREDLEPALRPDVVVECDFGKLAVRQKVA